MTSILCSGSIALDTTRTPFKTVENVLGGAASFFSLAASFFASVHILSVVGKDFPEEYWKLLEKKANLNGVQKKEGKTFHYDSTFSFDLYHRQTNKTELNVLGEFEPVLTGEAKKCEFVYLATMPPEKQLKVLQEAKGRKLVFMDTIEFYIKTERNALLKTMSHVDGVVLNDAEARMLTDEVNLIKCGKKIHALGPKIVIIKKGEHGCLLFHDGKVIPFPAFPLEVIIDPTGAGDAFAGGFLGYLAKIFKQDTRPTTQDFKTAMAYANVMGSLAVEDFSVNKLASATKEEVEKRFREYCELLRI
ncbi:MAG: PfkB family carbohydrate kinase [Candidatus Micrarchaeota archaeon]|nr:PfkB family carbohydrate kinase [Candidatus Micrarchaeota archaeon]